MNKNSKIYVAGHNGMVGSALTRKLIKEGYNNIIQKSSRELDLRRQEEVEKFFENEKPDFIFLAAAKVGGIGANISSPAEFIYDNLMIQSNIIHTAYKNKVKKLLFLGSSCIYPREAIQPMKETELLNGRLEPTNEAYALAKISGLKMCEYYNKQYGTDYISVMPSNLYGIGDSFDKEKSHVMPALIRKIHEAKVDNHESVEVWGTGNARREMMFCDDLADACILLMNTYKGNEFFNIGTGKDVSIRELAYLIKDIVGYKGKIVFDTTKADGMPQKLLDVTKLSELGWMYKTELKDGIKITYEWFLNQKQT